MASAVTRCTIRRPTKPKNAFQQLIAAVQSADARRMEDAAVAAVRDRLKRPKKPLASHSAKRRKLCRTSR